MFLIPYWPKPENATGAAMMICPGGGYTSLDPRSGKEFAARVPGLPEARQAVFKHLESFHRSTLEFAARRVCGISPSLLSQLLRARRRRSFTDTLMDIRLEGAAQLLAAGRNSVRSIAQAVGYAEPSCFCELFKRRFRVTPGRYSTRLRAVKVQTDLSQT